VLFEYRIMRVLRVLPVAALAAATILQGQSIEQILKTTKQTIDQYAVTRHVSPPSRSTETKWEMSRIQGCTVELRQSIHREEPDSMVRSGTVLSLSEDRVLSWTFDLSTLRPHSVLTETVGGPHITIFGQADSFHLKTDVVSRNVRRDGSVASTNSWSTPGTSGNLWIYFDSPDGDNKQLVKRVAYDLQSAIGQCVTQAKRH
jgi:hypothetical protein